MSKAIEKATPAGVPALANTPAVEIGSEDIALPRVKVAQGQSATVQEGLVKLGSIYSSTGADDPDPITLWTPGSDKGLRFHVLSLRKGKSLAEGGQLQSWAFNDPDAPAEAWTTYDYGVYLPEHDEDVPYKFLFTRTSTPAAKNINLLIKKQAGRGPAYGLAFEATTVARENAKGKFFVLRVRQVEADPAHVTRAAELAELVAGTSIERSASVEPAI